MIGDRAAFLSPIEPGTDWTDEAIEGLVGQTADLSLLGEAASQVRIVVAKRADPLWPPIQGFPERPALWVEVERLPPVTPEQKLQEDIRTHRLTRPQALLLWRVRAGGSIQVRDGRKFVTVKVLFEKGLVTSRPLMDGPRYVHGLRVEAR